MYRRKKVTKKQSENKRNVSIERVPEKLRVPIPQKRLNIYTVKWKKGARRYEAKTCRVVI